MLVLELFDLDHALIFELSEFLFPISIEFLKFLVTDLDIFSELPLLDVNSKLILELVDVCLQKPDLSHEILVQLVLLDIAELLRHDGHLLLDY
jgi:hypothetical protein